jgi:polyphosphate kinase 2 (PPK2 family)
MPDKRAPYEKIQAPAKPLRIGKDCDYDQELRRLHIELVKLHEWIRHKGLRLVILFEGRDAAGKGGAIKRITEELNPRICRVVALGTPTEREKTQLVFPALRGAPSRCRRDGPV